MRKSLPIRIGYVLLTPIILMVIFCLASEGFGLQSSYIVLSQAMIPLVMGFGVAFTFVVGIFEMSVGSQVILSAIVGGILSRYLGFPGLIIGAVGTGLLLGCIMGTIYKFLRIPTMVISLGMMMLFEVVGQMLTKGSGYVSVDGTISKWGTTPNNFIIAIIAGVIFFIIYHKTKFGHRIRALGLNDILAVNLGLDNNQLKFVTYVWGGMFYGIAGALTICYAGSITAKMNLGSLSMMFPPIISVLIGLQLKNIVNNFSLAILIGAFSISILSSGLIAVGLPATMQDFITGVFMLVVMIISTNGEKIGIFFRQKRIIKKMG